ncbi:hypothetical protein [Vibrio sp. CK2-1]|uniref:hypothetical protein n=1 Tax=Vibrio sp. CK2-1 TaxID=2912249 RepID=UPI001F18110D|nr:hypothetical protein [Vibrio sp. CK2-1]MCF7353044.1 hypothetical protein [Vibrio sp. CK2-1]
MRLNSSIALLQKKQWYVLLLLFFAIPSFAEFSSNTHIDWLGLEYQSNLAAEYGYNDNVLYQEHNQVIGSDYVALKPELSIAGKRNTKDFYLFYQGDYRQYNEQQVEDDSYNDHFVYGAFDWELGIRHHLSLSASYKLGHEARGSGATKGFYFYSDGSSDKQATFSDFNITHELGTQSSNFSAQYTYGAKGAKGNLIFGLQRSELDYDILDSYDPVFQDYLKNEDSVETRASIDFRHQVTGHTRLDYTLMYKTFDYLDPERDNDEYIALFSLISEFTGKSKLEARVYYLENKLASSSSSSVNWSLMYQWKPVDYSTFIVKSSSEAKENDNTGDYIQSYQNSVTWKHEFLGHVSSDITYNHINDEYQIKDNKEQYDYLDFRLGYLFRPNVELSLLYRYALFTSDDRTDPVYMAGSEYKRDLGYEQNEVSLSLKVGI